MLKECERINDGQLEARLYRDIDKYKIILYYGKDFARSVFGRKTITPEALADIAKNEMKLYKQYKGI